MYHNPYSSHYHRISQLQVPYSGSIPNGLVPGKQISIAGEVPSHAYRFAINLITPQGIALHFNPRFDDFCIVRNSNLHGNWENEERHGGLPINRGQRFELNFVCQHDRFQVIVNGGHVFDFYYRQPLNDIHTIEVSGDILLHKLTFSGHRAHQHKHLNPPFAIPIHGINPGKLIKISGHIHNHTNRFNINLQNGPALNSDAQNIDLHLSTRFDDPHTGRAFVRTNKVNWNWGAEERYSEFPFQKGQHFEMLILCDHSEWKVAVNGRHITAFGHRNSFYDVNHISVDGDVEIHSITEYN